MTTERARSQVPERVDVAVIGAGLGGLVAAALLAKRGKRVAVFEAHYVAGGCATQFVRGGKGGRYHFDVGLHYIGDCGMDGTIPAILRELGISIEYVPLDPDGFDTLLYPGLEFRIPSNVDLYRDRLVAAFPAERHGIDRYVGLLKAVMIMGRAMENGGRPSFGDIAMAGLNLVDLARFQDKTLAEVLDATVRDPLLKAVLAGQHGDYGLPPSQVSAMLHLGLQGHYFRGAYYPKGGGQVIADKITERLEELGGTVHLRRPVERILVEGGRAVGVRLAGKAGSPAEEVRADVVLSNADLIVTLNDLLGREHLGSEWAQKLSGFTMAAAIFITFLGVRGDLRQKGMRAANYWQFDDTDSETFYRFEQQGNVISKGCYITSASIKDPASALHHAPSGISNVEVMTVVPGECERWHVKEEDALGFRYKDNEAYRDIKRDLEDQMIDRLEKIFPGTKQDIVFRESASPVSHLRYTRATGGTGYGLAATPAQFLGNRPGYSGPLPGLYLAGASTRSGHGIVGAMLGGRNAAKRIARDLGLEERPKRSIVSSALRSILG